MKKVVKKDVCDELVKNYKAIKTIDTSNLVKKLTLTQKLMNSKRKLLIMTIVMSNFLPKM